MSSTPQTNPENQEIDLSQVSKKIGKPTAIIRKYTKSQPSRMAVSPLQI